MIKRLTLLLTIVLTARLGTITYDGHRETFYNLRMHKVCTIAVERGVPGLYWEREDGCKMFGDYIIVAADFNKHPYGSLIETSRGTGIVLDTGSFEDRNTIDIATNW